MRVCQKSKTHPLFRFHRLNSVRNPRKVVKVPFIPRIPMNNDTPIIIIMVGRKPLFPLHQIMNQFDFVIFNTGSQSFLYFTKKLQFRMSLHEITDFLFVST